MKKTRENCSNVLSLGIYSGLGTASAGTQQRHNHQTAAIRALWMSVLPAVGATAFRNFVTSAKLNHNEPRISREINPLVQFNYRHIFVVNRIKRVQVQSETSGRHSCHYARGNEHAINNNYRSTLKTRFIRRPPAAIVELLEPSGSSLTAKKQLARVLVQQRRLIAPFERNHRIRKTRIAHERTASITRNESFPPYFQKSYSTFSDITER